MSQTKISDLVGCVGLAFFVPVLLLVAGFTHAFVLTKIWAWYIAPAFHLPVITMVQAYGLFLFYSLFVDSEEKESKKSNDFSELLGKALGKAVAQPFVILTIAWVVKTLFM